MIGRLTFTPPERANPLPGWRRDRRPLGWLVATGVLLTFIPLTVQGQDRPPAARKTGSTGARPSTNRTDPGQAPIEAPAPSDEPEGKPGAMRLQNSPRRAEVPPPPRDPAVIPAAAPAEEAVESAGDGGTGPLPGATAPPPGSGSGSAQGSAGGDPADPFVLKPERLATGPQQVLLSVEVRSAAVINLGKETPVRILIRNEGSTDAYGVRVVYQLPEGLQFVSSEAPATNDTVNPQIYIWNKAMMAAKGEWSIGLRVVAKDTKPAEHVAHVTAAVGTRLPATVQEPKLRVEAVPAPSRVPKGKQVKFEITVSNPGTGPARDVNVQVKLGNGLKQGDDDLIEHPIDLIKPGERITLEPLQVDTVAGGQQACNIEVRSPDVNFVAGDHRIARTVDVSEPKLAVDLTGPDFRYTGQAIEYKLTVSNPGTFPATGVVLSAALPQQGGRLARGPVPSGSVLNKESRKLIWRIPQLDPGQTIENRFVYDTSTVGFYQCSAEAIAGPLRASKQLKTEVSGIADLDLKVDQTDRVIDVGKSTYYDFKIKNVGTKEATKLLLSGTLVNLEVTKPYCDESNGEKFQTKPNANGTAQIVFPVIPKLAAGQEVVLSLEVVALRGGKASASVQLAHDDMGTDENSTIKGAITTTVTDHNRPPPRSATP